MVTGEIAPISSQEAKDFLLPRHYSGRVPSISKAFGWRERERRIKGSYHLRKTSFTLSLQRDLRFGME